MAPFQEPWNEHRLDWELLQNSPIALYFRQSRLDEDLAELRALGYDVFSFDCTSWSTEADLHKDMAATLRFPGYYGHNLDALNDCLSDLEIRAEGGLSLVFLRFDVFAARDSRVAQIVLDIIAHQARFYALLGLRLLALVQSDDPQIEFEPVGACPVMWNPREWLNAKRGL